MRLAADSDRMTARSRGDSTHRDSTHRDSTHRDSTHRDSTHRDSTPQVEAPQVEAPQDEPHAVAVPPGRSTSNADPRGGRSS
jgi:hypothetical protein